MGQINGDLPLTPIRSSAGPDIWLGLVHQASMDLQQNLKKVKKKFINTCNRCYKLSHTGSSLWYSSDTLTGLWINLNQSPSVHLPCESVQAYAVLFQARAGANKMGKSGIPNIIGNQNGNSAGVVSPFLAKCDYKESMTTRQTDRQMDRQTDKTPDSDPYA